MRSSGLRAGEATDDPAAVLEIDLAAVLAADMIHAVPEVGAGHVLEEVLLKLGLALVRHCERRLGVGKLAVKLAYLAVQLRELLPCDGQHLHQQGRGVDAVLARRYAP